MLSLEVKAIGSIRELGEGRSLLHLLPGYADALHGLEPGLGVQVLYWMHGLTRADRRTLRLHPGGDVTRERRGVFALRSCTRPNPIGVSEVEVLEVRDAALVVAGLDAKDGSPLIDIKALCC